MPATKILFRIALVVFVQMVQNASSMTIDEMIQDAANSSHQFEFLDEANAYVKVELDMQFKLNQWQEILKLNADESNRHTRKAIRDARFRWPGAKIPYEIATGVFSDEDMAQINAALDEWRTYTCIQFRRSSTERSRVRFQDGGGCASFVGQTGDVQTLTLARGCRQKGTVVHELGHAVGFHHEQTRPDRDRFVRILRENIPENVYFNFRKYSTSVVNDFGVPYDYNSVMHYGKTAFSVNGQPTIETLNPSYQDIIGNRRGLSFLDIKLANLMYNCAGNCSNKDCPGDGFVGKDCQCWCRGNPVKACNGGEIGGGNRRITTQEPVTLKPVTGTCYDMNRHCNFWATNGECERFPGYMWMYCKKSCGVCDKVSSCQDMNTNCAYWQGQGYCTRMYVTFMRSNCPRACGLCSADEAEGSTAPAVSISAIAVTGGISLAFIRYL